MGRNIRCKSGHWIARPKSSVSAMRLCVLPHAVLGSAPFVPAGMLLAVGGACACGVEGVCGALGCLSTACVVLLFSDVWDGCDR